ncbi:hypothetical protein BaRGS_00013492 [Batillaria attramentaria]|uniref:Uncharacterized protein n=1 Tax=Batillaria attramentaria TaxID=370345 RepID=A0ABD0L813_9CAEN
MQSLSCAMSAALWALVLVVTVLESVTQQTTEADLRGTAPPKKEIRLKLGESPLLSVLQDSSASYRKAFAILEPQGLASHINYACASLNASFKTGDAGKEGGEKRKAVPCKGREKGKREGWTPEGERELLTACAACLRQYRSLGVNCHETKSH